MDRTERQKQGIKIYLELQQIRSTGIFWLGRRWWDKSRTQQFQRAVQRRELRGDEFREQKMERCGV